MTGSLEDWKTVKQNKCWELNFCQLLTSDTFWYIFLSFHWPCDTRRDITYQEVLPGHSHGSDRHSPSRKQDGLLVPVAAAAAALHGPPHHAPSHYGLGTVQSVEDVYTWRVCTQEGIVTGCRMSTHLHFNFQVGFGACARVRLTWLDRNRCVGVNVILCSALLLLVDDWNDERSTHWSCCHDDSSIENKSVHTLFMLSINQEYLMYAQQLYNKKSLHTQTLSPQSKYRFTLMFNWIIIVFTANFWRKFLEIDACN